MAVFHRGWTMKQGRSDSGAGPADDGVAATVVVTAVTLTAMTHAAARAILARVVPAIVLMVVSWVWRAVPAVVVDHQSPVAQEVVDDG